MLLRMKAVTFCLVFVVFIGVAMAQTPCSLSSYAPTPTSCNGATTRTLNFEKVINCTGGISAPSPLAGVSCECTTFDYAPVYGTCSRGLMTISYVKSTDCTGGVAAPADQTNQPCACPVPAYTDCTYLTNKRSLIYYYSTNVDCAGNLPLPPVMNNIPCDVSCGTGSYLPLGALSCSNCSSGTFSLGGGQRYVSWNQWPEGFSTYCSSVFGTCSPWTLNTSFIGSGSMNTGLPDIVSTLQWSVELARAGSIQFTYRVDAEKGVDGLTFLVDGQPWTRGLVSYQFDFVTYQASLPSGYHLLQWVYSKDSKIDVGLDEAMIQMIQITGLDFNVPSCTPCPAGYTSGPASVACTQCPINTYSTSGSASCTPCQSTEYAPSGSASCLTRPACTVADFTPVYGACINGERSRSFAWLESTICDTNLGVLPTPDTVPCLPCKPGMTANADGVCEYCPSGTAGGAGGQCTECTAGSAAVRTRQFTDFETIPADITTSCSGNCATQGFIVSNGALNSGQGHGEFVTVTLQTVMMLSQSGSVLVSYDTSLLSGNAISVQVSVDNFVYPLPLGQHGDATFPVNGAGNHTIRVLFSKNGVADASLTLSVHAIIVHGVAVGGADDCEVCPAGTHARGNGNTVCGTCAPGTYSLGNTAECSPCEANTFSSMPGAASCDQCGAATTSQPGSSTCTTTCVVAVDDMTYNLSPLNKPEAMWGPVRDTTQSVYFINVCSPSADNHTCTDSSGNNLPSYACQQTSQGWSTSIGSVLSITPFPKSGSTRPYGLVVEYSGGDVGCTPPTERTTTINMICDPSVGMGQPEPSTSGVIESPPDSCHYVFDWKSSYACPLCTAKDDIVSTISECINGEQQQSYYWKTPATCFAGLTELPAPVTIACSALSQTQLALIVVGIVAVLMALAAVAFFFIRRNRQLTEEYSQLQGRRKEMSARDGQQGGQGGEQYDEDEIPDDGIPHEGNVRVGEQLNAADPEEK